MLSATAHRLVQQEDGAKDKYDNKNSSHWYKNSVSARFHCSIWECWGSSVSLVADSGTKKQPSQINKLKLLASIRRTFAIAPNRAITVTVVNSTVTMIPSPKAMP